VSVPHAFARGVVEAMTDDARSRSLSVSGSLPLESQRLVRLLVFSTAPDCQGDGGSQNHLFDPKPFCR